MPRACSEAIASSSRSASSATGTGGSRRATSPVAPGSISTPLGSAVPGSRTMTLPAGAVVERPTPARRSASLFAHSAWPEKCVSATGCRGAAASSAVRVGRRPSGKRDWSQP